MKKFLSVIIILIGALISLYFAYRYIPSINSFVIRGPIAKAYVKYFKDEKPFDPDHLITNLDNGMSIIVNKHDQCVCWSIRLSGHWDSNETKVIKKLIQPGDTVVEVGANFGVHTLRMAELVGKEGHIYAFEANPRVVPYLQKSIEMNHLADRITLYNKAVSNKEYKGYMVYGLSNIGGGYILPDTQETFESCKTGTCIPVEGVTLDQISFPVKIDILKIDAEGSEAFIIEGAKKILEQNKNIILMMEWTPSHLIRNKADILAFVNYLKKEDFKFWFVNKKGSIDPISAEELIETPVLDIIVSRQDIKARFFK